MDSFGFQNIKAEKANAMFRYRRVQKITAMFRLIEICIFLIIISRFTTQLPVAFKLSGEYFRGLSVTAISPRFVFIVGNVIILVLFLKSGQLSAKDGEMSNGKVDLYEEYVKNCEKNRNVYLQEIEKRRKQSPCVNKKEVISSDSYSPKEKTTHRSHSENSKRQHHEEKAASRQLRRTVTEINQKCVDNSKKPAVSAYPQDEMSSEEFRRTVEAFIARQQRFLREEEKFSATVSFET